ncbi:MAG: efflux RND transporter periplasmic adaptor subunit [Gemmatimonadota bacterium]
MKKKTKIAIAAVATAGVVAVSVVAAMKGRNAGTEVRLEAVATRDLVSTVTASGWIRPHRRVDVQSDIIGRIIELNVKEGANVQRGQLLLRIEPTQFEAAVSRARAAVQEAGAREAQARANMLQAERAYERLAALGQSDQNLVSRQQIEEAETQLLVQRELLTAAGFGVAQARSALAEAEDQLAKTVVRAPMDGIITRLNVEVGSTAMIGTMNNPGSILLTVADLSSMEAVVRVDETDVPDLQVGDSATITVDAFARETFTGRVTEIGFSSVTSPLQTYAPSAAGGQAIDYEIVITLDNPPPSLRSDLSVSADIVTARRTQALSVPIIALTVREKTTEEQIENENPEVNAAARAAIAAAAGTDEEGVFVVRDGIAHFVPVVVGIAGREHFEVISGLTSSDTVVAGPYEAIRSLEDGQAVRPLTVTPTERRGAITAGGS